MTTIQFPSFTGIKCNMMPFMQGDSKSLPEVYQPYAKIVDDNYLEKGEIGYLTIDESYVEAGRSQRGYNGFGLNRNVHVEVGRREQMNHWGGNSWGGGYSTLLDDDTKVLIANSVSDTCRVWDAVEMSPTEDGDLGACIHKYLERTGVLMKAGDVAKISIFTPHECVPQKQSGRRQFFRIVGKGVRGRESYFTLNPLMTGLESGAVEVA